MFWFRLALKLGMTLAEAQQRINSREFAEWIAFDRLDPIAEERADARAAMIAHLLACAFRGKGRAPKFEDFMPDYEGRSAGGNQDAAAMEHQFTLWAGRHNRKQKRVSHTKPQRHEE